MNRDVNITFISAIGYTEHHKSSSAVDFLKALTMAAPNSKTCNI